jgi:hypothetical protein
VISSARARRVATAAAATVIGLSTVAIAAPANADSRTLKDGKGDTWNVSGTEPKKDSGNPVGDLRKLTIKHTERKVVVTARLQNLKKAGQAVGLQLEVKAPGNISHNASVFAEEGAWKGQSYVSGSECDTKESMNYRQDVITLDMPTRCFDRPEWLKFRVYGIWVKSSEKAFIDNAHTAKLEGDFTRRIERG